MGVGSRWLCVDLDFLFLLVVFSLCCSRIEDVEKYDILVVF